MLLGRHPLASGESPICSVLDGSFQEALFLHEGSAARVCTPGRQSQVTVLDAAWAVVHTFWLRRFHGVCAVTPHGIPGRSEELPPPRASTPWRGSEQRCRLGRACGHLYLHESVPSPPAGLHNQSRVLRASRS